MPNDDQKEYWNERAGEKWAAHQEALDVMLMPVTALLLDAVGTQPGKRVLDVGCGTGDTAVVVADGGSHVTGVDISQPMLAIAKERLGGEGELHFADASEWKSDAPFDVVMSRFGVMFFDDPVVAFTNIRSNMKPDGKMVFACWQAPAANDWVMTSMIAIKPYLPETPEQDPHAPGPFALADPERLRGILTEAGFADIQVTPHDVQIMLAAEGGVDKAVEFSSQIGPAAAAMAEVDDETKEKMLKALRDALAPHDVDGHVALKGGIWIVEAKVGR